MTHIKRKPFLFLCGLCACVMLRAPVPALAAPSGGLQNVVVMSLDKCYAALGKKEAFYIETHDRHPYMACTRRLKLKRAAEKKAKEKKKKETAKKESLTQKEISMQKNAAGDAGNVVTPYGGYYRVPPKKTHEKSVKHAETP